MVSKVVAAAILLISLGLKPIHAQVRLSPDEAEKLITEKPDPTYPSLAVQSKLQGIVKVDITVSETGTVVSRKVIGGHPFLISAALDAVQKWKYRPHVEGGKVTSFVTTVEVPFSLGIPKDEYEQQEKLAREYFKQADKCRGFLKERKWMEAEEACKEAVPWADKLGDHRQMEKMGAYEQVGHVLLYQRRFEEALRYFTRALEFAQLKLKDTNAEMGYTYRNLGMAHHGLGNLDKACEFYTRAEKSLELAHGRIGSDDLKERYIKALRDILKVHLMAADQLGATTEVAKVKKQLDLRER